MKKILILFVSLLCILNSCQVDELKLGNNATQESEMTLYYVGVNDDSQTRTSLTGERGNRRVLWSENDMMNIFFGVNNDKDIKDNLTLHDGAGTDYGTFYGPYIAVNKDNIDKLHQTVIVYPFDNNNTCVNNGDGTYTVGLMIPSVQTFVNGSFANGSYPMIGVTENPNEVVIKTKSVNSGFYFSVKGDKKIEKIVLSSEEALAGPAQVVASYGNDPIATVVEPTAINTVELLCNGVQLDGDVATDFCISFAPCNGTVTAKVYDTEGGYMDLSWTKDFKANIFTNYDFVYEPKKSIEDDLKNLFKNGGSYKLPMDYTVSDKTQLVLASNKSATLDLDGHTLTSTHSETNYGSIYSTNASILRIINGTLKYEGTKYLLGAFGLINDKSLIELTDVAIDCDNNSKSRFMVINYGGANIKLNNVVASSTGDMFTYAVSNHRENSLPGITINGGKYKTNKSAVIFKDINGYVPVQFYNKCLFSDKSYTNPNVQWVETGDATYKYMPLMLNEEDGVIAIYNLEQLKLFAENVNAGNTYVGETIVLKSDIDLNNEQWMPIGYWETFDGTFDGQGHTIYNLKHHATEADCYIGFFGCTNNATIKNLNIENADIKLIGDNSWAGGHIGALVGYPDGETIIEYINITGTVKIEGPVEKAGAQRIGAVVGGYAAKSLTMNYVNVDVTDDSYVKGHLFIGGVAGAPLCKTTMTNVSSNINVFSQTGIVGGIIGYAGNGSTFNNCISTGDVTRIETKVDATENQIKRIGGIAGTWEGIVNLSDCSYTGELYCKNTDGSPVTNFDFGGIMGRIYANEKTGELSEGTLTIDGEKVWPIVHFEQDANGNMVVYTEKGLKDVLTQAGAAGAGNTTIKLSGNLDMTGIEWTPIKVDGYNGADVVTLDGNGYEIKGLTSPLFEGGFAGGSGIVIKNLTIADSQIKSTNATGSGAFVETSDSQAIIYLENCHLINSSVEGSRTGGLVGWTSGYSNVNDGPVKSYITFENCSVEGCTIKGSSVGGLNGHAGASDWTYTTINNCTVKDCSLESSDTGEWRVGVAVGTANTGEVIITNLTESNNTLSQTGKTAPEGEKRNYFGRFVPGTTGKLVIDGVNYVGTPADLASALTSDNQEIKVVLMKDIDLPISSLGQITGGSGEYKLGSTSTNKIIIDLNQNRLNITTTYWSAIGAKNDNATITIKNGTMTSTGNSAGTWNAFDLRFSNCNYVIENVDFEKAVALDNAGKNVEMNNVTITETHDYYALWITAEGQNVNISNMTINSDGRGIKIDEQYVGTPEKVYLNVDGLKVRSNKKAAIVVKSIAGADITLSRVDLTEVTADKEYAVWCDEDAAQYANLITVNGGKMKIEGTTPIADGVLINKSGEYELSSKAGLEWLSSQVASGNNFSGKTVKLTTDINLDNVNWSPIGGSDSYTNNFAGTFDGNGKTISNLKVENAKCAGLFGTMTAGTIKNLTISGAKLTTNHYAGAVVAWMEKGAQPFTIDNCHVKNITILVTPDGQPGAYDNGDKAGAVAGFMHYGSITNCTIENADITAYRDLGGVVGYANGATVKDNSVTVATLTVDQLTNYYGDKAVNVGEIIGRRGVNLIESGNTYSSVTIGTKTQQAGNFNKPVVGGDF